MFIRKLLDLCFSKRELSYLDDLMPEWKKKRLDDASKKMEEAGPGALPGVTEVSRRAGHTEEGWGGGGGGGRPDPLEVSRC